MICETVGAGGDDGQASCAAEYLSKYLACYHSQAIISECVAKKILWIGKYRWFLGFSRGMKTLFILCFNINFDLKLFETHPPSHVSIV